MPWRTTTVTLNYDGDISYGGPTGDSTWFTKPSMELLEGTYTFHFRGGGRADLTFSGCEYEVTVSTDAVIYPVQYKFKCYKWLPDRIFEQTLYVCMKNASPDKVYNVKAFISSWPSNVTVVDGEVTLGDIRTGRRGKACSQDTYKLQVDMKNPVDRSETITWMITYDDAAGNHYIILNVPQ